MQAEISKVQTEHFHQQVGKSFGDLKWSATDQVRGERCEGGQIPYSADHHSRFVA